MVSLGFAVVDIAHPATDHVGIEAAIQSNARNGDARPEAFSHNAGFEFPGIEAAFW